MLETYGYEYAGDKLEQFKDSFVNAELFKRFTLKVEGGFNFPSLRNGFRLYNLMLSDPNGEETIALRDKVAKECVAKKAVHFFLDNEPFAIGAVITDPVNQSLDADPVFTNTPALYDLVLNLTTAHVLGGFLSPKKDTVPE